MKPLPGEYEGLRLAARAADRAKAAEELRADFEKRLKALGYTPLGIARAFSLLSGPGTVAQALEVLERRGDLYENRVTGAPPTDDRGARRPG